jgi:hypothetical protein
VGFDRLVVVTLRGESDTSLLLRERGVDRVVATRRADDRVAVLDAVRVTTAAGRAFVVTSEFDAASQSGRVVAQEVHGDRRGPPRECVEGETGSVLWWLVVRDGALFVRDVRFGTTRPVPLEDAPPAA